MYLFQIFVIKILDPDSLEMLDPDSIISYSKNPDPQHWLIILSEMLIIKK